MSTLHRLDRDNRRWYAQPRLWWLNIVLCAGLVYFTGIAHESIWFDEAFSYMMASHSPGEILGLMTMADNHPPLLSPSQRGHVPLG